MLSNASARRILAGPSLSLAELCSASRARSCTSRSETVISRGSNPLSLPRSSTPFSAASGRPRNSAARPSLVPASVSQRSYHPSHRSPELRQALDVRLHMLHNSSQWDPEQCREQYQSLMDSPMTPASTFKVWSAWVNNKNVPIPLRYMHQMIKVRCDPSSPPSSHSLTPIVRAMRDRGLAPDKETFAIMMQACAVIRDKDESVYVLDFLRSHGDHLQLTIGDLNAGLECFADTGDVVGAMALFGEFGAYGLCPNEESYGLILHVFGASGNVHAAPSIYKKIREDGMEVTFRMVRHLVEGAAHANDIDGMLSAVQYMKKELGLLADSGLASMIVNALRVQSRIREAVDMQYAFKQEGVDILDGSYALLLKSIGESPPESIQEGVVADCVRLLEAYTEQTKFGGSVPSLSVYNGLLLILAKHGSKQQLISAKNLIVQSGHTLDATSYNYLISGMVQAGDRDGAMGIYDVMKMSDAFLDAFTFNQLFKCCKDDIGEMRRLLMEMRALKVHPDKQTFLIVLDLVRDELSEILPMLRSLLSLRMPKGRSPFDSQVAQSYAEVFAAHRDFDGVLTVSNILHHEDHYWNVSAARALIPHAVHHKALTHVVKLMAHFALKDQFASAMMEELWQSLVHGLHKHHGPHILIELIEVTERAAIRRDLSLDFGDDGVLSGPPGSLASGYGSGASQQGPLGLGAERQFKCLFEAIAQSQCLDAVEHLIGVFIKHSIPISGGMSDRLMTHLRNSISSQPDIIHFFERLCKLIITMPLRPEEKLYHLTAAIGDARQAGQFLLALHIYHILKNHVSPDAMAFRAMIQCFADAPHIFSHQQASLLLQDIAGSTQHSGLPVCSDISAWNLFISGARRKNDLALAKAIDRVVVEKGIAVNTYYLGQLVELCRDHGDYQYAADLHMRCSAVLKSPGAQQMFIQLIDLAGKAPPEENSVWLLVQVMKRLQLPFDSAVYGSVFRAVCARRDMMADASKLIDLYQSNLTKPPPSVFSMICDELARVRPLPAAFELALGFKKRLAFQQKDEQAIYAKFFRHSDRDPAIIQSLVDLAAQHGLRTRGEILAEAVCAFAEAKHPQGISSLISCSDEATELVALCVAARGKEILQVLRKSHYDSLPLPVLQLILNAANAALNAASSSSSSPVTSRSSGAQRQRSLAALKRSIEQMLRDHSRRLVSSSPSQDGPRKVKGNKKVADDNHAGRALQQAELQSAPKPEHSAAPHEAAFGHIEGQQQAQQQADAKVEAEGVPSQAQEPAVRSQSRDAEVMYWVTSGLVYDNRLQDFLKYWTSESGPCSESFSHQTLIVLTRHLNWVRLPSNAVHLMLTSLHNSRALNLVVPRLPSYQIAKWPVSLRAKLFMSLMSRLPSRHLQKLCAVPSNLDIKPIAEDIEALPTLSAVDNWLRGPSEQRPISDKDFSIAFSFQCLYQDLLLLLSEGTTPNLLNSPSLPSLSSLDDAAVEYADGEEFDVTCHSEAGHKALTPAPPVSRLPGANWSPLAVCVSKLGRLGATVEPLVFEGQPQHLSHYLHMMPWGIGVEQAVSGSQFFSFIVNTWNQRDQRALAAAQGKVSHAFRHERISSSSSSSTSPSSSRANKSPKGLTFFSNSTSDEASQESSSR